MCDKRALLLNNKEVVALHVATLILRENADKTTLPEQKIRLLAYAERLDVIISNSTVMS